MENLSCTFWDNCINNTRVIHSAQGTDFAQRLIFIVQSIISSVGILSNATVVVVFLNHKKFRQKIPNMFIINQVIVAFIFYYPQPMKLWIGNVFSRVCRSVCLSMAGDPM